MAKYKCSVCGYIYDEEKEGAPFAELSVCPMCKQPASVFVKLDGEAPKAASPKSEPIAAPVEDDLKYPEQFVRRDDSIPHMSEIHEMALTGKPISAAMATQMEMPKWDEILILGAQLDPMPLDHDAPVITNTVIGKNAKRPMVLQNPVYVSHMSFGALSREAKIALSKGSAIGHSAMCSGEGGILPEEMEAADKYIFEYVPNKYSVTDENLKNSDAIEIKIGQGTKPGMGGHLPGEKVTAEISKVRERPMGVDVQSPSKFPGIETKEDLKDLVSELRSRSDGRPIGIKIAAGHIEDDLKFALYAEPDFITIDGRGGATGSSPKMLREATSVPTIYALARARKYLDEHGSDVELVITGGLRVSADFAKAIAMGADAVAIATAALMAAGCQQYRICGTGMCPVGIATQDPVLRKRFQGEAAAKRVGNFLCATLDELRMFARVTGKKNIHDLSTADLITTSKEIAEQTGIRHA